jgi:hypothetical protein
MGARRVAAIFLVGDDAKEGVQRIFLRFDA